MDANKLVTDQPEEAHWPEALPRGWRRDAARELRRRSTPTERRLWRELRAHRFEGRHFRRQHPVGPYIADSLCQSARLILEVDGEIHENQKVQDAERDAYLGAEGYMVLRIPSARVIHDLPAVLVAIRALCEQRR